MGANYLTESMVKYHRADPANRCYCTIEDGIKVAMPRYYRNKIFTEDDKLLIADRMQEIAIENEYQLYLTHGNNLETWKKNQFLAQQEKHYQKLQNQVDQF